MAASPAVSSYQQFFQQLASAPQRVLLLDYDGTLAPFTTNRSNARPYPAVRELLDRILALGTTRLIVISGRTARELPGLLGMANMPEIWGAHVLERIGMDGSHTVHRLTPNEEGLLHAAHAQLQASGLGEHMESKPGGLAVHWRGLETAKAKAVSSAAKDVFEDFAHHESLRMLPFHCGVELRVKTPNKGTVVEQVQRELPEDAAIAYLGDDVTDEDAFVALRSSGLAVLVSDDVRATAATVRLRPPDELVGFLCMWLNACGGTE